MLYFKYFRVILNVNDITYKQVTYIYWGHGNALLREKWAKNPDLLSRFEPGNP